MGLDGAGQPEMYLTMDSSIACYGDRHLVWVLAVGLPMLLLYVFGIPAFCLYQLRSHDCQVYSAHFTDTHIRTSIPLTPTHPHTRSPTTSSHALRVGFYFTFSHAKNRSDRHLAHTIL